MADNDPINDFIALPREQQMSTLQKLSPEKQEKLLAKVKERHSSSVAKQPTTPTATLSAEPKGILPWLEKLQGDVKLGTGFTAPGRALRSLGAKGTNAGVPEAVGDLMPGGGTIQGGAKAAHGVGRVLQGHPVKGANEVVRGVGQALAPFAAATNPAFLPTAMGYGALGAGVEKGAKALGVGDESSEFIGNVITSLLGAKSAIGPSTERRVGKLALAAGKGTTEPIENTVGTIIETSKQVPNSDTVGGFLATVNKAKDNINSEYGNALGPYARQLRIFSTIAQRIRALKDKFTNITEEDRQAKQIIENAALNFEQEHPLGEYDRMRTNLNIELSKLKSKEPVARYTETNGSVNTMIDVELEKALREVVYPEVDRLAGKPMGYFERLKQQQMNLIKLEQALNTQVKELHDVSVRSKAAPAMERTRVRGYLGETGNPRFSLTNILGAIHAPDPEAQANKSIAAALKPAGGASPLMALPIKALLAGDVTAKGMEEAGQEGER